MPYQIMGVWFNDDVPRDAAIRWLASKTGQPSPSGEPTTDLGAALKSGFYGGLAGAPEHFAGIINRFDTNGNSVADWLTRQSDKANAAKPEGFVPDTIWEKIASGVASAPGQIAEVAPYVGGAALAIGAAPVSATAAALAAAGIGFGLHGAGESFGSGGDAGDVVKEGLIGGAEGIAFEATGGLAKGLSPLARALVRGSAGAAVGGTSAAVRGGDSEDIASSAATAGIFSALTNVRDKSAKPAELTGGVARAADVIRQEQATAIAEASAKVAERMRIAEELDIKVETLRQPLKTPRGSTKEGTKGPINETKLIEEPEALSFIQELVDSGRLKKGQTVTLDEIASMAEDAGNTTAAARLILSNLGNGKYASKVASADRIAIARSKEAVGIRAQLNEAMKAGDESIIAKLSDEYNAAAEDSLALMAVAQGLTAEAARTLRYKRELINSATADEAVLARLTKHKKLSRELFDQVADGTMTDSQLAGALKAHYTPKLSDKVHEFVIMGLLTNPGSHVVNIVSGIATQGIRTADKFAEPLIDIALSARPGRSRSVYFNEFLYDTMGIGAGLKRVLDKTAIATGIRPAIRKLVEAVRDEDFGSSATKIESYGKSIGGPAGKVVRAPGMALSASDEFFRTIAMTREAYSQAARIHGRRASMNDVRSTAGSILDGTADKKVLDAITNAGNDLTFTNPLRKDSKYITRRASAAMSQLRESVPATKAIVPFLRTPANIALYAMQHSPMNLIEVFRTIKRGGAPEELVQELAKTAVGGVIAATAYEWAKSGFITGGGPRDQKERAVWEATGAQPRSFKIGDQYISYERIEPIATIFGAIADLNESGQDPDQNVASAIVGAIRNNLTDKTFLLGVENLMNALGDPERFGQNFAESLAAMTIPAGVGMVARAQDPKSRRIEGPAAAIQSRIPGLRENLPPVITITGEDKQKHVPEWKSLFGAARVSYERPEAVVEREMYRLSKLGFSIPSLPQRRKAVPGAPMGTPRAELSDQQYELYRPSLKRASEFIGRMMQTPVYQRKTDEQKAKFIRDIYSRFRKRTDADIRRQLYQQYRGQ